MTSDVPKLMRIEALAARHEPGPPAALPLPDAALITSTSASPRPW